MYKIINGIKVKVPRNSYKGVVQDSCPKCGNFLNQSIDSSIFYNYNMCHKCKINLDAELALKDPSHDPEYQVKIDNLLYLLKIAKTELLDAQNNYNDDMIVHDIIDSRHQVEVLYESENTLVPDIESKIKDLEKQIKVYSKIL